MENAFKSRSGVALAVGLFTVVGIGLASRLVTGHLPRMISKDLGDGLWGLMFFLIVLLVWPRIGTLRAAIAAMVLVSAIEFFKLCHAPWVASVRGNSVGGLLLGRVFLWGNFVSYAAGVLMGVMLDRLARPTLTRRY